MNKVERKEKYGADIEKMHGKAKINANDVSFTKPVKEDKLEKLAAYDKMKQIVDDAQANCERSMAIVEAYEAEVATLAESLSVELVEREDAKNIK